jgi:hypothetical protein
MAIAHFHPSDKIKADGSFVLLKERFLLRPHTPTRYLSASLNFFSPCKKIHQIQSASLTERTKTNEREEMRKASTLIGLSLFALAASARAQEAAPAADDTAAPPASVETAAPVPPAEPAAPAAPPTGLAVAAPTPVEPAASHRRIQIGLSFLPMVVGKYTYSDTFTSTASAETYFAYGLGLSAGDEVLPGLVVGLAPQVLLNVQPKPTDTVHPPTAKEYDLMVRIAYESRMVDTITVYAEVLPGYSRISPSDDTTDQSTGLVLAIGAGCAMDLSDRFFLNLGGGYQMGFQSQSQGVHQMELRTKYVRVAMGGGVRF